MDYMSAALLSQLLQDEPFAGHRNRADWTPDLVGWGPRRPPRRVGARRRFRARLGLRPAPTGW